jgi:3-deoxy-7-phosphoheptulonate synthase
MLESEQPYKRVSRQARPKGTRVRVGDVEFGGREFVLMAGPCAVESEAQIMETARSVAEAGARVLRGGVFKPRTSPYAFRGHGKRGLEWLARAGRSLGLPVVTEVLTAEDVPLVAGYADILQIGARNMQNFVLLEAAGASGKPVLLKRGLAATLEEWLLAAEYIALEGNLNIILCERGIRTFGTATRNTLDLASAVLARELTHLPVIVDPSHATGHRQLVGPMARAAAAAGVDGVILEVHPQPECALCDGPQSLTFSQFRELALEIAPILASMDRHVHGGSDEFFEVRRTHIDRCLRRLEADREKTSVQIAEVEAKMVRLGKD